MITKDNFFSSNVIKLATLCYISLNLYLVSPLKEVSIVSFKVILQKCHFCQSQNITFFLFFFIKKSLKTELTRVTLKCTNFIFCI